MPRSRPLAPARTRKPASRYHHGDLRRALLEEALQMIHREGVAGLTLRGIGARLGVSRAALYRHFADKHALLMAVAAEGFRMLRVETAATFPADRQTVSAFADMAVAYVGFALRHPSHYRVMFGGSLDDAQATPELAEEGAGSFNVLVNALVALQSQGHVRKDNPLDLARFVWSTVHGVAMLAIDGQLMCKGVEEVVAFTRYTAERIRTGIAA
jgi:AcrR family transcriptional regulator